MTGDEQCGSARPSPRILLSPITRPPCLPSGRIPWRAPSPCHSPMSATLDHCTVVALSKLTRYSERAALFQIITGYPTRQGRRRGGCGDQMEKTVHSRESRTASHGRRLQSRRPPMRKPADARHLGDAWRCWFLRGGGEPKDEITGSDNILRTVIYRVGGECAKS